MNRKTVRKEFALNANKILAWYEGLPAVKIDDALNQRPHHAMVCCVDMVKGFCDEGILASERVGALRGPVCQVLKLAHEAGVRTFTLIQDGHSKTAPEFQSFPPHCLWGGKEAETIEEIALLGSDFHFQTLYKNATSPAWAVSFNGEELGDILASFWLETVIVVGDCTDLCVYQTAMFIKTWANQHNKAIKVIVPASAVQTYDLPYEVADSIGAYGHTGDFWHIVMMYHMALNGIDIVREIK